MVKGPAQTWFISEQARLTLRVIKVKILWSIMDPSKGKPQHSLKGYKSNFSQNYHHENNNYNIPTSHGVFRTSRIQRHSLRWNYYSRGNCRSKFPYRKNDLNNKKSNKSAEDVEEEERKKKLTDTAKKLLSKIKTWNAEKSHDKEELQQNCTINQVVNENSCKNTEEKTSSEGKPKRIAHSKKAKLMKSRTPKGFSQPTKGRYDVNKETVKDFQNRIQHKLIEDIMQMPKENLQNVLNDPKINPIMELKMSRLVRENKLLIAQKLRALAESKMKTPGNSTNPQLLVEIDKLIDPVIETDLSVLPYELIKKMENVFQVQFDYSPNIDSQIETGVSESVTDSCIVEEEDIPMEMCNGNEQQVKVENNEDLSLYECSTDEDEDEDIDSSFLVQSQCSATLQEIINKTAETTEMTGRVSSDGEIKRRNSSIDIETPESNNCKLNVGVNKEGKTPCEEQENEIQGKSHLPSKNPQTLQSVIEEAGQNSSSPEKEFSSTSCQTEGNFKNFSTQTTIVSSTAETIYGLPIPKQATDESISSLLEEVNSIQNLTNKLNERRFMIFLQLAKMSPSGSFISDDTTKKNFIETLSNGNGHLVEVLTQFFNKTGNHSESSKHQPNETKRTLPERSTPNKARYKELKKNSRNQ